MNLNLVRSHINQKRSLPELRGWRLCDLQVRIIAAKFLLGLGWCARWGELEHQFGAGPQWANRHGGPLARACDAGSLVPLRLGLGHSESAPSPCQCRLAPLACRSQPVHDSHHGSWPVGLPHHRLRFLVPSGPVISLLIFLTTVTLSSRPPPSAANTLVPPCLYSGEP
jgi:hypothetical protein